MFELRQYKQVSFSAHNEMMKQFRKTHDKVVMAHPARVNKQDILSMTLPSAINCISLDSGGSYSPERLVSRSSYLSLPKVAGYKLSPN
jgi:hypothetical protein